MTLSHTDFAQPSCYSREYKQTTSRKVCLVDCDNCDTKFQDSTI
jgi:hypothetical protein